MCTASNVRWAINRTRLEFRNSGAGLRTASCSAGDTTNTSKKIHCAIYTRKSTDEGLDQDLNSLDAQRESAEAFIRSQQHEGWIALPDHYDDGGLTGGNMERPALKRLLGDVQAGKVDCIVVYKVDRLSRSLIDFARIIPHRPDGRLIQTEHDPCFIHGVAARMTQGLASTTPNARDTRSPERSAAQPPAKPVGCSGLFCRSHCCLSKLS